jgi:glycosyltransferase involved in cell wall biosynthesis
MSKKDILFFGMHRPDRSPSQRYRIEQYFSFLEKNDVSFDYDYILDENMDKVFYSPGRILGKLWIVVYSVFKLVRLSFFGVNRYKKVFIQREAFMLGTPFFEKQIAKKVPVIFDFDDSIWMHHVSEANKKLAFLKNPLKTAEIIKVCDKVIAGNSFLAEYASKYCEQVQVLPTVLNTEEYKRKNKLVEKESKAVCIGWSGSLTTIKHFQLAVPVLRILKHKYGDRLYFKVIGDENYQEETLGIQGIKWTRETEIEELEEIDIGIMPLPNDKWSLGKCGLKGLVYMSMEIPSVVSPVGFNKEIIEDRKDGFFCDAEQDWFNVLSELIENPVLRKQVGRQGRMTIEERYSVVSNQDKFLAAIS